MAALSTFASLVLNRAARDQELKHGDTRDAATVSPINQVVRQQITAALRQLQPNLAPEPVGNLDQANQPAFGDALLKLISSGENGQASSTS